MSCPRVDFSENRRLRTTGRNSTLEREQIATYAIPAEAFGRINTAKEVTFTAGPTSIDLTDEHLATAGLSRCAAIATAARPDVREGGSDDREHRRAHAAIAEVRHPGRGE
mgnify:CR=1 FL=1